MIRRQQLDQRSKLGLDFLANELGGSGESAHLCFVEPRRILIGLGGGKLSLDPFDESRKPGKLGIELGELCVASRFGFELGELLSELARLGLQLRQALLDLGFFTLKTAALGASLDEPGGRLAQHLLGGGKRLSGSCRSLAQ